MKPFTLLLILVLCHNTNSLTATVACGDQGDCITNIECNDKCGCDKLSYYNETTGECELNQEYLKTLTEKYNTAEIISQKAEEVFNGILVSVILFISCSSLCAVLTCIYCCHIHFSDLKLERDVQALAKKLNRDGKLKKLDKTPLQPKAESCNVVVEDAGVFVC